MPDIAQATAVKSVEHTRSSSSTLIGIEVQPHMPSYPALPVQDIIALHKLSPDYVQEVIEFTKREQEHRHALANRHEANLVSERKLGLFLGAFLCFAVIVACVIVAWLEYPWAAATVGSAAILGVATLIINVTHPDSRTEKGKTEKAPENK